MRWFQDFSKARAEDEHLTRLLAFTESQARPVERRFLDVVTHLRDEVSQKVQELYAAARFKEIPPLVDEPFAGVSDSLTGVFAAAGTFETNYLIRAWDIQQVEKIEVSPAVDLSFDPGDPEAARLLRLRLMDFIREITEEQKRIIAQMLRQARELGLGAVEASRMFRDSIGLTEYQLSVVESYRRALQSGSSDALQRVLRDRRFDSTVGSAIRRGTVLDAAQVNRMVARYKERMIAMRAETIARTETRLVVSQARHIALHQMASKAGIPFNRIMRRWRTVVDGRERHTHHGMNGQIRGIKERFVSPSGAKLMFPGDRSSAPANETINCRCAVLSRLLSPAEAEAGVLHAPKMPRRGAIVTPPVPGSLTNVAPPLTFDTGRIGSGLAWDADYTLVYADVDALDVAWQMGHPDYYLPRGWKGKTPRIREAAQAKKPLPVPEVALDDAGAVNFTDGRNRFVYLRDQSKQQYIPVAVPKSQAAKFKRRFQFKEAQPAGKPKKMTWDNWIDDSSLSEGENYLNWLESFLGRAKRRELTTTSELMRSASWSMHARDLGLIVKEDIKRWSTKFTGEASEIYKEFAETFTEMTKSVYLNKIVDADRLLIRANTLAERLLEVAPGQASKLVTQEVRYLFKELKPKGILKPVKPKKPVTVKPKKPKAPPKVKEPKAPKKPKAPAKPKKPVAEPVAAVQAAEDDIVAFGRVKPPKPEKITVDFKFEGASADFRNFADRAFVGANNTARRAINRARFTGMTFTDGAGTHYSPGLGYINMAGMSGIPRNAGSLRIFAHEFGHHVDTVLTLPKKLLANIRVLLSGQRKASGLVGDSFVEQHEAWSKAVAQKSFQFDTEAGFQRFMRQKYGANAADLGMLVDQKSLGRRYLEAYIRRFETETGVNLDMLDLTPESSVKGILERAGFIRALETGDIETLVKVSKKMWTRTIESMELPSANNALLQDLIGSITRLEYGVGHSAEYYSKGAAVLKNLKPIRAFTTLTDMHTTEAFANWFSFYTAGAAERALLRRLAPILYDAFEGLLKNIRW